MYINTEFGDFEWDDRKAAINFEQHGIAFDEAVRIFQGLCLTTIDKRLDYGEKRQISIGSIEGILIAAVVHTERGQATRIISARPANKKERRAYSAFIQSLH